MKTKQIKLFMIATLCVMIQQTTFAQFIELTNAFKKVNALSMNEQLYLHTDREVYTSGDTIWFNAYIRNKATLKKSTWSNVLFVSLIDANGGLIQHTKYFAKNGISKGYLILDKNTENGIHNIVAYSSWMKNFSNHDVYSKKILVRGKDRLQYLSYFNKSNYYPGDTVKVKVKCFDYNGKQIDDQRIQYQFHVDAAYQEDKLSGNHLLSSKETSKQTTAKIADSYHYGYQYIIPNTTEESVKLSISNLGVIDTVFNIPLKHKVYIDFFPEGGNRINNMTNTIAFKATFPNGQAATISGDIIDDNATIITDFKTELNGMGKFFVMPDQNQKLFLRINSPSNIGKLYPLPNGLEKGWMLKAKTNDKAIFAEIYNNINPTDTCLITLNIRGYLLYFKTIPVNGVAKITIPITNLKPGVGVLTIYDKNKLPRAERLVYINSKMMDATMTSDKAIYKRRDPVTIKIKVRGTDSLPANGQYSLSVFDDDLGTSDLINEPNIIASFFLNPYIKGTISNPNEYFSKPYRRSRYFLDLLLMTQGWRRYVYQERINAIDTIQKPVNKDIVSGQLKKPVFGKDPLPGKGSLDIYFAGNSQTITSDENGNFSFLPEYTEKFTSPIMLTAKNAKGKNNMELHTSYNDYQMMLQPFIRKSIDSINSNLPKPINTYEEMEDKIKYDLNNDVWLEEVLVNAKKNIENIDPDKKELEGIADKKKADKGMLQSATNCIDILLDMGYDVTEEQYGEDDPQDVLMVRYRGDYVPVRFFIDGFDRGTEYIETTTIDPESIVDFYVIHGLAASNFTGTMGGDKSFLVYIKTDPRLNNRNNAFKQTIQKLEVKKEFFQPKYDTKYRKDFPVLDLRKTIHWQPNITLNEKGEATVKFYNGDRITKIKCVLEGIDDNGIPSYTTLYYDVEFGN